MMFLISEVHPFADGNGRVGRIMMNAELVSRSEQRIIIPTVYRNNYLSALRALSHNAISDPLIRVLDFAQRYTLGIHCDSFNAARLDLERTHAFMDSKEAEEKGLRLILP
jgi:fido (protein-threonine AMPylation protein)